LDREGRGDKRRVRTTDFADCDLRHTKDRVGF